jgi:acyl-CoA synthetase (AMP-forming)/AMP-acid ligase II
LSYSSGKIAPGYEARIVDEEGRESRTSDIGNLWIPGGSAAAGYWNRPELTEIAISSSEDRVPTAPDRGGRDFRKRPRTEWNSQA